MTINRRLGLVLFASGLLLSLACHIAGGWQLRHYGGDWKSQYSIKLGHAIRFYDAASRAPEVGRAVIFSGFGGSPHIYFPLAISLLRSGYSVRLVCNSGSPGSSIEMEYRSHALECSEAAEDFNRPGSPLFLIGHSEGTRYALKTGREMPSVAGVIVMSPISTSLDAQAPRNVLILLAEDDFDNVNRQAHGALLAGTAQRKADFDRLYGDLSQGTARKAEVIPRTNHFNIFLNLDSQRKVLGWMNEISHNPNARISIGSASKSMVLALLAVAGALMATAGIGILFRQVQSAQENKSFPPWTLLIASLIGWAIAGFAGSSFLIIEEIPLLVYGRVLSFFLIAAIPLMLLAMFRPRLGAGIPCGSWKARIAFLAVTAGLLLFDTWFIAVLPAGRRLFWFSIAFLISGGYFALDEFLRRQTQRTTDWKTGLAMGLAGSLIAALSVAITGFFLPSLIGHFLMGGAITLFVLLATCEIPATYLFAATGDWLLSWWVRVFAFNAFLAALVPLVSETAFRKLL